MSSAEQAKPGDRPRVIFVGPDPDGQGGMATVCKALLGSWLADHYRMTMIVSHRTGSAIYRLRVFAGARRALRRALRQPGPPPVVHVHTAARGSMYRKALIIGQARRGGARVIVHLHTGAGEIGDFGRSLGRLRRAFFSRALASADLIIGASRSTADELERQFDVKTPVVLNNPLPEPIPQLEPSAAADGPLLYLGGFANPVKGAAVMIEALRLLEVRGEGVDAVFAGDGEPTQQALELARWDGWLAGAGKEHAIRAASAVAIPSTSEGLPVVLLEAMAYGKAVVATRVGAIPEVITDQIDGLLVPSGDAEALAEAIARLQSDTALRAELGLRARERARQFSLDSTAGRLDELYRNLLTGGVAS